MGRDGVKGARLGNPQSGRSLRGQRPPHVRVLVSEEIHCWSVGTRASVGQLLPEDHATGPSSRIKIARRGAMMVVESRLLRASDRPGPRIGFREDQVGCS